MQYQNITNKLDVYNQFKIIKFILFMINTLNK